MARKKKFTKTLSFRILCIIAFILLLEVAYNFVVSIGEKKPQRSEEEQQAELQEKASRDTIDIIGDYLWSSSKPKKAMAIAEKSLVDSEIDNEQQENKDTKEYKVSEEKDFLPIPAPEIEPVPEESQAPSTKSAKPPTSTKTIPNVEQVELPKVEKID